MADYFVWESRRRDLNSAIVVEFPDLYEEFGVNFLAGRRFEIDLPELEVRIPAIHDGMPTDDLVVLRQRCLAHSDRLRRVLHKAGVDNIDYYPLRIIREMTGDLYRTHHAANILDVIFCMDREKSVLDIDDENPFHIWFIDHLVLKEERLGDSLCFRLGERPSTVIVHRHVKEAVEAAGMTGPVFLPVEGYREYQLFERGKPRNVVGTHDDDPDGPADAEPDANEDETDESAEGRESTEDE
jgi:hypothetical protein